MGPINDPTQMTGLPQLPVNMPSMSPGVNPLQAATVPPKQGIFSQLGSNLAKSPLGQLFTQGNPSALLKGIGKGLNPQAQQAQNMAGMGPQVAQGFQAQNQQMHNLLKGLTQILGSKGYTNPTLQNAASNPDQMLQVSQANAGTSED